MVHHSTAFKQDHVEGYLELSAKTKTYFATAVKLWDAEYYVKVDDDVHVNIGNRTFANFFPRWALTILYSSHSISYFPLIKLADNFVWHKICQNLLTR